MTLRSSVLVLLAGLLLPVPLSGQDSDSSRAGASSIPPAAAWDSVPPGGSGMSEAQIFLGAFRAIIDYGYHEMSDSALWERAIEGLISELNDPYATVFTPEEYGEFRESTTGDYAGIGVQITKLNGAITITAVFRATPAQDAGLQVGDQIVGVKGHSTEEWSTSDASDSIRGDPGTNVKLLIQRRGFDEPMRYTITRNNVHISAVTLGFLPDSVGYLHLDRVARGSAQEVDSALTELASARGIIFDLRRNPGGYLDESLAIADLFLERGKRLASTKGRAPGRTGEQEESFTARMRPRVPSTPIIVLVDEFTASAAEIVSGALQDHDRALILGQRTFGKGVVQTLLPLPANRRLRLTTGSWYTPLGRSLHRPRDSEGRPLPEDPDTFPTFMSDGGRTLVGGGGVFPDLTIQDDTLSLREREFLQAAARNDLPLGQRLAEVGFSEAQRYRSTGGPLNVSEEAFQDLLDDLRDLGVSEELLDDPDIQAYLKLRARIQMADRLNDIGKAAEFRMTRDPVLQKAYDLLERASTQGDLFAMAVQERNEPQRNARGSGDTGAGGGG